MVRKLEVIVPAKHSNEIRDVLMMNRSVHHLSYRKCITTSELHNGAQSDSILFSFMVVNKKTHELIELLTRYGVSSRFGHFNVSALTSTKPKVATIKEVRMDENDPFSSGSSSQIKKKKRKYKISDRLAYDEVYDTIDSHLHLTFDYLALIFIGGIIAAVGLLTNSAVAVVASMLVSPLMGPIVGMTFGAIIKDNVMLWKSFRNELIGVFVCFLTGAFMGFMTAPFTDDPLSIRSNTQIQSRGEWIALAWGAGIAAPSGIGVALGVSSDQVSALIGVAISAALLPPIVNSGVCLASAFIFFINPKYDNQIVDTWFKIGYISMLLFFLNWILIFIFGIITFRAKNLHQSANEQIKLERLNKFYALRDKMEQETDINVSNQQKKENLQTPLLLSTKPNENNTINDININIMEATSNKDVTNIDMTNWDKKVQSGLRHERVMSATVTVTDPQLSQKRKVKGSSFDASVMNVSINSSKGNKKSKDSAKGSSDDL